MRSKFLAVLLTTLLISTGFTTTAQAASTATVNWANTLSTGSTGAVHIVGTGIDSSGNIYAAGYANGAFVDGGTTYTPTGSYDILLVKYNSAGVKQWLKLFGSAASDQAYRMTVSPSGTSYITGTFCGSVTVAPLTAVAPSSTTCDGMLIAVNSSGNGVFFQKFSGASSVTSSGVRADANNNSYVVVTTDSMTTAAAGGGTGLTFTVEGGADFGGPILYKFDSTGTPVWVKPFAKGSGFYGNAIALDGNGDILVGGSFSGTSTFDSLGTFTSSGFSDGYVAKIPANGGAYSNLKVLGGAGHGGTAGIGVTSDGSVVAMVEVTGANVLNGVSYTSAGSSDDLVFKLSGPTWTTAWTTPIASSAIEAMFSLVVDADNRVYVSGGSRGNINFGTAGTSTAFSGAGFDGYMIGIEADGTFAWYKQFLATNFLGVNSFNAGLSVSGNTVVGGGYFTYSQTYGDGVTATVTNTANSGEVVKVTTSAAPVVVSNSNSSSTPPPPPPITIDAVSTADLVLEPGADLLSLQGSNLDSILKVEIDDTVATIKAKTESKIEVQLPELDRGYHDITFFGKTFRVTYVDSLYVKETRTVNLGKLSTLQKRLKSATKTLAEAVNQDWRKLDAPVCQLEINNKTSPAALKRYQKIVAEVCSQLTWRYRIKVVKTTIKNPIAVVLLKG